MKSYYRKCKHCGRRIQMRQMPAGQWVAFEGYDTIHDCNSPPPPSTGKPIPEERTDSGERRPGYDDLDFVDFNVPGDVGKPPVTPGKMERPRPKTRIQEQGASPGYLSLTKVQNIIDQAIADYRVLTITFVKRNGEKSVRDIEPLLRSSTHCTAYCRLKDGFRTFRLDGIKSAIIKQETFSARPVPTLERQRLDSMGAKSRKWTIPTWIWVLLGLIILIFLLSKR